MKNKKMVIYVMENKVNHKKYIGQTNDFHLRMNGHRSDAFNPNSHSYNYPLSNAIRKYGWDNFNNYIIEEIPERADYEYVDERERYFIAYFHSLNKENGYNITLGGQGCPKQPMTYEQLIHSSKLFTPEEIIDIQNMLRQGTNRKEILDKYPERLTDSYLSNINNGWNFKNPDWHYPLYDYSKNLTSERFTKEQIHLIKQDIINGISYEEISKKWDLAPGMISQVNNGKSWYEKEYNYPLSYRNHSRCQNANTWVKDVQQDLINSNLTQVEIAKKYNKAYSTIKKINSGASHKNPNYKYPLTSNRT